MRAEDVELAIGTALTPECGEFVKWTVLAAESLCRGDGAVIPPPAGQFHAILEWRFRHIEDDDVCQRAAASNCADALIFGAEDGEGTAAAVDSIPASCPALPYGAPCRGAGAQACLHNRIATMIRALNTPLSD
jgi:hypothetical protein